MARFEQLDDRSRVVGVLRWADGTQQRFAGVQVLGVFGAHKVKIKLCQSVDDAADSFSLCANPGGKF